MRNPDFRYTFQCFVSQIEYSRPWKVLRKSGFRLLSILPKSSFGRDKFYGSQTKILEGQKTAQNAFSTHFSTFSSQNRVLTPWKVLRKHVLKGFATFEIVGWPTVWEHKLVKGWAFMLPKRRFWKAEQTVRNIFSTHFSRTWVLDLGEESLKSASKRCSGWFVRPSKIFVWESWPLKPLFGGEWTSTWWWYHDTFIVIVSLRPMWETTFPRNTHAGFCKDFTTLSYTK